MGMFDWVKCKYQIEEHLEDGMDFQTKDTPAQNLDTYVIEKDGTLWHQVYDIEDRSDPMAEGFERFVGSRTRTNYRLARCAMTGEISFYGFADDAECEGWIEYSAYFKDGALQQINQLAGKAKEPTQ